MDFPPATLDHAATLHFHATGAVTYLAGGQAQLPGWDDDAGVILSVAA